MPGQVSMGCGLQLFMGTKTYPVVVNDLGDDGELASRGTFVDKNDTADLDEAFEGGWLVLQKSGLVTTF